VRSGLPAHRRRDPATVSGEFDDEVEQQVVAVLTRTVPGIGGYGWRSGRRLLGLDG